jgi:hypothetical protein
MAKSITEQLAELEHAAGEAKAQERRLEEQRSDAQVRALR